MWTPRDKRVVVLAGLMIVTSLAALFTGLNARPDVTPHFVVCAILFFIVCCFMVRELLTEDEI